jgi:hypothetical protein
MYGRTPRIPSKAEEYLIKPMNQPRGHCTTILDVKNESEQDFDTPKVVNLNTGFPFLETQLDIEARQVH